MRDRGGENERCKGMESRSKGKCREREKGGSTVHIRVSESEGRHEGQELTSTSIDFRQT